MDYSPLKNHQYWLHSPVYSPLIIRNSPLITIIIHIYHDIHHISPWLSPLLPSKRPSLLGIHHHIHHYNLHMSPLWTTIYQYQPLWKPWFTVVDHFFRPWFTIKTLRAVPCRAPGSSAASAESHGAALAGVQVHRGHRLATVALAARAAAVRNGMEGVGSGARWVIFSGKSFQTYGKSWFS